MSSLRPNSSAPFCTWLAGTLILLMISPAISTAYFQFPAQKQGTAKSPPPPFTLDRLLLGIQRIRQGRIPEKILVGEIQQRGLSFPLSAEVAQQLKNAGASNNILNAIEAAAKKQAQMEAAATNPPPPPPPPKPKEGILSVRCEPADCTVLVGTERVGRTKQGRLEAIKRVEGEVVVTVQQDGYDVEPKERRLAIAAEEMATATFKLTPTRAALQAAGLDLLTRMVQALGGDDGLKASNFLRATGTLNVVNREGRAVRWDLISLIKLPDRAKFNVRRLGQNHEIFHADDGFRWNKPPQGPELQELEDALRLVYDYQLPSLILRLRTPGIRLVAEQMTPAPDSDNIFRAEGSPDTFVITVGPDFRPKEIKTVSNGLNSGLAVLFSDFSESGKAFYPRVTQVLLPGTPPRGVEARYTKVELNPEGVKDSDLALKKGK